MTTLEREDYWIDQYKRLGYEVVNENKALGKCIEKQRKTAMRHYWKNKDKCLERCKQYYWDNKEKRQEYQRKRYHKQKYGNLDNYIEKFPPVPMVNEVLQESCLSITDVVE